LSEKNMGVGPSPNATDRQAEAPESSKGDDWVDDPLTPLIYTYKGEEGCFEEKILAELLAAEVMHCNNGKFGDDPTLVLFVLCNDLFAWACADSEPVLMHELPSLYRHWLREKHAGVDKWCCKRRNQRPQAPVEREWRRNGTWDAEMEALPSNTQDAEVHAQFVAFAAASRALGEAPQTPATDAMPSERSEAHIPQEDSPSREGEEKK